MQRSNGVTLPADQGAGGHSAQDPADGRDPALTLRTKFHHIGLVFAHPTDPWPLLAGSLGGRFVVKGSGPGYGYTQFAFANGFVVEGIYPEDTDPGGDSTIIKDFLDRHGPGPHHLTFSVNSLDLALERLGSIGLTALRRDHQEPFEWSELLIKSDEGYGVVVQLLGDLDDDPPPPMDQPEGLPEREIDAPVASLARVVHAVADLDGAVRLFRDGLGGKVLSTGCAVDGNHWVELGWIGAGRLRLLEGTHAGIAEWIGDRRGRIRHLFFNFDEPEYIPGAVMVSPGRWVVGKENVLGTRLVLSSSARLALEVP